MAMEHPPRGHINAQPPHRPRYPNGPEDWDRYKQEIGELYAKKELKDVMKYMEDTYSFKATRKQWTTRLKKWDFTKRNEAPDYRAMLKKKRQREQERPGVPSQFILRDEEVPASKIARWEDRARKEGRLAEDDTLSDAFTPPGLLCRTPPSARAFIATPANQDVLTTDVFDQRVSPNISLLALRALPNESQRLSQEVSVTRKFHQPPLPILNIRTPPLPPFGWWELYANSIVSGNPARSTVIPTSAPIVKPLQGFTRILVKYKNERIYTKLIEEVLWGFQCAPCRWVNHLDGHFRLCQCLVYEQFDEAKVFLGAAIGRKLLADNEPPTCNLAGIARTVGPGLCRMGKYAEAESLLWESFAASIEIEDGTADVDPRTVIDLLTCDVGLGIPGKSESFLGRIFQVRFRHLGSISSFSCQDCTSRMELARHFYFKKLPKQPDPPLCASIVILIRKLKY